MAAAVVAPHSKVEPPQQRSATIGQHTRELAFVRASGSLGEFQFQFEVPQWRRDLINWTLGRVAVSYGVIPLRFATHTQAQRQRRKQVPPGSGRIVGGGVLSGLPLELQSSSFEATTGPVWPLLKFSRQAQVVCGRAFGFRLFIRAVLKQSRTASGPHLELVLN